MQCTSIYHCRYHHWQRGWMHNTRKLHIHCCVRMRDQAYRFTFSAWTLDVGPFSVPSTSTHKLRKHRILLLSWAKNNERRNYHGGRIIVIKRSHPTNKQPPVLLLSLVSHTSSIDAPLIFVSFSLMLYLSRHIYLTSYCFIFIVKLYLAFYLLSIPLILMCINGGQYCLHQLHSRVKIDNDDEHPK